MWVKICGTTNVEDAQLAVSAGADAVGFVFAPSKRQVTVAQVAEIASAIPAHFERVGVFHSPDVRGIADAVRDAELTAVQMHFPHQASFVLTLRGEIGASVKLLQVISCSVEALDEAALRAELLSAREDANLWGVLLDAKVQGNSGGTGRTFDWSRVAQVIEDAWFSQEQAPQQKLILAGGLRPENVRQAIAQLSPFGVDVVSGVEKAPGQKDAERVLAFVAASK